MTILQVQRLYVILLYILYCTIEVLCHCLIPSISVLIHPPILHTSTSIRQPSSDSKNLGYYVSSLTKYILPLLKELFYMVSYIR